MKAIYWINEDEDMIYEVHISDTIEGADGREGYNVLSAELVCGKEYPTDNYGIDGLRWCSPFYFVDDVQHETIVQYFESESMKEAIEDQEGWHEYIGELPRIYEWVDPE